MVSLRDGTTSRVQHLSLLLTDLIFFRSNNSTIWMRVLVVGLRLSFGLGHHNWWMNYGHNNLNILIKLKYMVFNICFINIIQHLVYATWWICFLYYLLELNTSDVVISQVALWVKESSVLSPVVLNTSKMWAFNSCYSVLWWIRSALRTDCSQCVDASYRGQKNKFPILKEASLLFRFVFFTFAFLSQCHLYLWKSILLHSEMISLLKTRWRIKKNLNVNFANTCFSDLLALLIFI